MARQGSAEEMMQQLVIAEADFDLDVFPDFSNLKKDDITTTTTGYGEGDFYYISQLTFKDESMKKRMLKEMQRSAFFDSPLADLSIAVTDGQDHSGAAAARATKKVVKAVEWMKGKIYAASNTSIVTSELVICIEAMLDKELIAEAMELKELYTKPEQICHFFESLVEAIKFAKTHWDDDQWMAHLKTAIKFEETGACDGGDCGVWLVEGLKHFMYQLDQMFYERQLMERAMAVLLPAPSSSAAHYEM